MAKAGRRRLDELLVERGHAESRARAQALILAGLVFDRDGHRLDKAGKALPEDAAIEVKGKDHPWVSRGGVKLAHGLDRFAIDPAGLTALDVGASTGGFTDVLLSRGAVKVYAVDVGHNQLAWKLREDPRVVVMEKTNARHLTAAVIPEPVDLVVCDASFIPLHLVLAAALDLAKPGARLVALIKPQFEVGPDRVGKGGIVRDPALHQEACAAVRAWLEERGWRILGLDDSPITGAEGNREFLIAAEKP
ncbi:MAG: TlyA family RNA methyltransferase [Alphaproteobacteria bacterium]|nr:TlyA family RNA methyltransferase [Alphaproteobacteria bacterium]